LKPQNSVDIIKITYNNKDITEPNEICNRLNEYYCTIGANLVQSLQPCGQFDFEKFCSYTCKNSIFCSPVSAEEIIKIICKFPNNKAPGRNNIKFEIFKKISSFIVNPLVYICDISYMMGIVTNLLKIAKVVPIYKKGERNLPGNY